MKALRLLSVAAVMAVLAGTATAAVPPPAPASAAKAKPAKPKPPTVDETNLPCNNVATYPGTQFRYCGPDDLIARSIRADGKTSAAPAYGAWDETVDGKTVHHAGMDPNMDWSSATQTMCFPIASLAYANSLVYRPGGDHYPGIPPAKSVGGQSDPQNFGYPWRDNFCESRDKSRKNASCGVGHGHQGQDIRPQSPVKVTYAALAAEDANVISVPGADGKGFTVTLQGKSPPYRKYRYLHMENVQVSPAHPFIHAGDVVGYVSDYFGWHWQPQYEKDATGKKVPAYVKDADGTDKLDAKGKPIPVQTKVYDHTLIHLHFEIFLSQAEIIDGVTYKAGTYVSPYVALINAYGRRQALAPGAPDTACGRT